MSLVQIIVTQIKTFFHVKYVFIIFKLVVKHYNTIITFQYRKYIGLQVTHTNMNVLHTPHSFVLLFVNIKIHILIIFQQNAHNNELGRRIQNKMLNENILFVLD